MKVYPQLWRCPKHGLVGNCFRITSAKGDEHHDYCLECLVEALPTLGIMEVTADTTTTAEIAGE